VGGGHDAPYGLGRNGPAEAWSTISGALNEAAIAAVRDILGGRRPERDGWAFDLGDHQSSNLGRVYGPPPAALVALARLPAPDRSPRRLPMQIVWSLPFGTAPAGLGFVRVAAS
jgi:hypothetical protein